MSMDEEPTVHSSLWTWDEDKAFEHALAAIPESSADRWERIAEAVPGKTLEEIKYHYEILLDDIESIESGRVPLPCYASSDEGVDHVSETGTSKKGAHHGSFHGDSNHGIGKGSRSDQERRKGIAWTEDEHRLFLLGLERFGKGDWRSISRTYVVTRTPTQVASHAQKYFIRLNSMNKDRRRSSIHDITSVENGDVASPQGPITGQTTNASTTTNGGGSSSKSSKQQSQPTPAIYSASTVGQAVAVGTPVNLSAAGHMAYGVRAPVPANMAPMTYSMPHASSHR